MNKWLKVIGAFAFFFVLLFAMGEYQSNKVFEHTFRPPTKKSHLIFLFTQFDVHLALSS